MPADEWWGHPLIDDREIYQCANLMCRQHGAAAHSEALNRADVLLRTGDADGHATWKRIATAVQDLLRQAPEEGEQSH
ncbi:hypothetical protein [Pelagibius sp. Alg239-R121]|uniref:hypothetical protein n=1 Tax=Pelagibius sp. Alg239-R121 TaxID=2993448 RepID=UPI0024A77E88|nr:hypothetical protein [Pelagibius sp. Alg239-R121]